MYIKANNSEKLFAICKICITMYDNFALHMFLETYVHPLRLVVFGIDRTLTKKKLKEMFPDAKRISISETEKTLRTGW